MAFGRVHLILSTCRNRLVRAIEPSAQLLLQSSQYDAAPGRSEQREAYYENARTYAGWISISVLDL